MATAKIIKSVVSVLVGLVVLSLILVLVFKLYGNKMIRSGIVVGAQKALQVPVRLEDVDLILMAGKANLNKLEIDNPEEYDNATFLKVGHAYVDLNVSSLFSDTVEITTVQLEDMALVIEQKGTSNNLQDILDNLAHTESGEPQTQPADKGDGKGLRIEVLEINNIQVQAELLPIPGRADQIKLPPIHIRLENIGTNEKIDMPALITKIFAEISKVIAKEGKNLLPIDMIGSMTKTLTGQVLDSGEGAARGLIEGVQDAGQGATDVLNGLGEILKNEDK